MHKRNPHERAPYVKPSTALEEACARNDSPWGPQPTMDQNDDPEVAYFSPWVRIDFSGMKHRKGKRTAEFRGFRGDKDQTFNLIVHRRKLPTKIAVEYAFDFKTVLKDVEFDPMEEEVRRREGKGTVPHHPSVNPDEATFSFKVFPHDIDPQQLKSIAIGVYTHEYSPQQNPSMREVMDFMTIKILDLD